MTDSGNEYDDGQVEEKAAEIRAQLEARGLKDTQISRLNLGAAARLALAAQAQQGVTKELVQAHMTALRPVPDVSADDSTEIWIETYGFLDLCYSIHLSPVAVEWVRSAYNMFTSAMTDAAEDAGEVFVVLMVGILAFLAGETGAILQVADAYGGRVQLEGVLPDPFVIPMPED